MSPAPRRAVVIAGSVLAFVAGPVAGATAATAAPAALAPVHLAWAPCGTSADAQAAGTQCATAVLPMDYDEPDGATVGIAVARVPAKDPAQRIGSLFFNFGGPGGTSVDYLQAAGAGVFAALNQRFDIVGFDPRGVGQSTPSIDCHANQETQGIYSDPVPTPLTIDVPAYVAKAQSYVDACLAANGPILQHASTANVARDMDAIRAALGEQQLNYLGFSYGTFLGATYATLFPDRYRAMVLDGPVDAQRYVNQPMADIAEQTAGFERAIHRFAAACGEDQAACSGFGGADPLLAYDHLLAAAAATPVPATGYATDPRPVTADDIRGATIALVYSKQNWGLLGAALAAAQAGDGTLFRLVVDQAWFGRQADGTYDPLQDRYFALTADEQRYPRDLATYLRRGAESWASFPHAYVNSGYAEISYALWPAHDTDAYRGPFRVPASSPTPLVVATTYDPATPYQGALRLVQDLGNARLITMDGDGHTAYGGNSACIDSAVETYLTGTTLPAAGTVCQQQVPFTAPAPAPAGAAAGSQVTRLLTQRAVLGRF